MSLENGSWPIPICNANQSDSSNFIAATFGTFTARKTKARRALNPRTGKFVMTCKTVRFSASPSLRKTVYPSGPACCLYQSGETGS